MGGKREAAHTQICGFAQFFALELHAQRKSLVSFLSPLGKYCIVECSAGPLFIDSSIGCVAAIALFSEQSGFNALGDVRTPVVGQRIKAVRRE